MKMKDEIRMNVSPRDFSPVLNEAMIFTENWLQMEQFLSGISNVRIFILFYNTSSNCFLAGLLYLEL
jgi:hypothetical protein